MRLATLDTLPDSASSGPESWGEAFGKVVSTTDQTMVAIENINASQENFRAAYQSYIDEVEQTTGVKLDNPMNIDMRRGTFEARPNPQYGTGTGTEWIDERQRVAMERFDAQRRALAEQYPAQARLIQLDIDGRATKRMQDADRAAREALASPELGMGGRVAAQLVGGLTGSAKDPYQWTLAMIGGGPGAGRTVAGRMAHVLLSEALINGGGEAVLQTVSQERKKRAGLEHGFANALKNVGVAATFGALFGSTLQGASELARIYKLGEGGEAMAARVLDGRPQPGDIETMAKAMNVELSPDRLDLINRSFEDRVLDDVMTPDETSPAQMRVYEASLRYAEDPDNAMPPELVERMVADEEAPRLQTLTPEQYERAYGGDANAIDDIADTFFADDFSRAAEKIDAAAKNERGPFSEFSIDAYHGTSNVFDQFSKDFLGTNTGAKSAEKGFFFARSPETAHAYFRDSELIVTQDGRIDEGQLSLLPDDVKALVLRAQKENEHAIAASNVGDDDAYVHYSDASDALWRQARALAEEHLQMGNNIWPVKLKIKNPLIKDYRGVAFRDESYADVIDRAIAGGHDGAIFKNTHDGGPIDDIYVVFDPSQIRSKFEGMTGSGDIEGQRIRPDLTAEPLDDGAMRIAESEAGDIMEPPRDRNGNPENMLDFIGIEDGDGNVQIVSAREALAMADEDNLFADLMEACKL